MKINFNEVTTLLFTQEINGRNTITAISAIYNKDVEEFADKWLYNEKVELIENQSPVPEDYMEQLRQEFKQIEDKIRNK